MENKTFEQLKLLYEISVQDLEFFKKQQWLVSYYAILIYGALFVLAGNTTVYTLVFCLAVGSVSLFSSGLLLVLEHSIGVRRARLGKIRKNENFGGKDFEDAWNAKKKLPDCHIVVVLMISTLLGGAVMTILGLIFPVNTG